MSSLKWFEELQNKRSALAKQIEEEGQEQLKGAFRDLFVSNPQVKSIVWTQYTPYFNDGEECIFSVNPPTFLTKSLDELKEDEDFDMCDLGELEYDEDENGEKVHFGVCDTPRPYHFEKAATDKYAAQMVNRYNKNKEVIDNVTAFYKNVFDEEVFRMVFGDHMRIVAEFDGENVKFDVDEYEHE